jgi:hypothetical protein
MTSKGRALIKPIIIIIIIITAFPQQTDHGVYVKQTSDTIIILAVYVDDLVIAGNNKKAVEE